MKYIPIFFIVVLANANLLAQVVIGLNMTKQISENWPYSTSQQDQTDVNYQPRVTNCNNSNSDLNCYLMMDPSKIQQSSKLGRDLTQMFDQGILNNRKPVIEKPPVGMTSVFNKFSNSSNVLNSATATMEAISDSFSSQVFGSEKLEGEDLKSTKKINEGLDSITSEYVRQVLEAYPCAGRLIIVEEGGVISIQARDAVQNASERNKSENKKIIDKLRELFPELAADSLLRYQVSSNNSKISMGVDSLTSSRLREILAKVDERGLARVQGGAVASSPEDSDYEDVDDESDFLSTQIQYNIETTGKAKVATRLLKKKIQAKKNLKNIIQQCNLGSNFDTMSVFSRRSKGSVVSVSSVVLERMIEEIAALKTAASQIMSEKPNTETVRLQLEAAETAWRDAEMEARHAATFSNTAETEKAFKEAVRLSQKVERAWDKAFNAKNTLLAKTSEADQPVLHDKIEEAEMQKRYWAAKILWNEAGQEECRATASLQQVIKPNNPGEVNLWYNRVIEIASNAETAWDKAATAFRGGAHLIPERLEDLKEQWMIDLEKADKSKNDWAQKVNEVKQEEIARKEAEQKEMERERKQAEEQAALENQKKKMEAIKKAEEERIAKAEKARIESERQAERQKVAEEVAKIEAARLQAEDKSDLATAALKEAQKLTTTKTKSVRAVAWNNALTLAKRAAEAWDEIVLLNRGQESKAAKMDKPTWRKALNNAENQAARWNARVIWREANKLQDEVISAQSEAQDIEQGSDQSIKNWSEVLELAQQAEGLLLQTVEIYKTNSKKALNEFKSDWNQAFQQAENKTKSWKEEVQKIREQKMRAETAKVVKAEYEEAQHKREGLWQEAIHQKEAVFAAQADAEKTKEGASESVVAWDKVLALAQQAETSMGEAITFVQEISKNIDKKFQSDWMTSFSQIEREKSQWTDEIIKIAEKKNQSEALLEREKAKQAAAEKAALEKAAREAQEAAEKAAEIQEAQTAWQECLMKRKVVAEKYRLAITAAEQYFSAGTKQAVPPDYVVDAILMANIKWKSARDASMAIYRRNMNSRNNDQDHRFCATNPEYRSAEMAANVVSATESSLREFVEKRYEADTAPISGSRANTIYAAAHNAVAQAYPPVYQAERAAGKNLVPHGAASLAATKASVAVVAPLIRAYAYDDASSTIVAAIAGAESFLAAVQKSSTADIQAGVSFGQYWTNALNACVREKNAWKNIANAGSSWNQAQLMAAQNATKEADQVFQVLKEARDAAYAVIDRPSSQQQQKALEKSQSAKLKAKVDQKRAEKFSAFQVPEAKEEEFYRIKVVRITTQIEEAKQASKEGWGGENSYLWDRIARKLEQSRESSNKAHKLVIQGKTEKSILWEKEAEASEASADGMRQVVQAYISGNKKAAEQLEKEKWNTFMASDISTWSLKSDEALEKANQEQGQNKNFWESLSMQYKAAVDYRRKALESYNLGKEDSCNLASIALSLHSSADYQAKVSEAENTGKTTLVAGYREAAAIYQEAANQYKKAIKVSTLERIRGERQSGEGTRLRQSGDAMQAEANAIAMKAEEANNAMQEADKSKNDWAQKVNEVKQEEIARKEAEQKEMERERKQAEEQAALENQKKKMEAIKKAEEERIAKAEKARIESERQAERQKAAEEKAKREREQADVEVRERAGREARNRMPINICKEKARKAQEKWTQLQSISQHHHYYYCADAYKQAASAYYTTYKMWRDAAETTSIISLPDYLQQAQRFEQEALNHLRAGNAQVSARYPTAFLPMLPENL